MNRNIQIRKDKFDLAKKRIHDLANNVPTVEELPTLETEGGWFGWSDKKVTGAEMNQITRNINNSFIKNNGEIIKIYNQFKEVYNTFDILDKEYIQGIIMATNEAKEASDKAKAISIQAEKNSLQAGEISLQTEKAWKKAEEALNRVIVAQTEKDKIIEALSTNILKLEETKIGIDREFSLLKKRFEEVESIKTLGESIQKSFLEINQNISTLERFKFRLEEYHHLKDIDTIWENVEKHKQEIKELHSSINDLNEDINLSIEKIKNDFQSSFLEINQNISTLERFKSRLEEYQHLKDIDVIWESSKEHHKQLASLDSQLSQTKTDLAKLDDTITKSFQETHESIQKSFSGVNQNISTLERFKSRLEEYQHLKDIDVIWESSKEHHKQLASLDSQLSQTKTDLAKLDDTITRSFQETHSEIDMKNELLKKRIYIAYWIAGGALFFSLLQFILLIFKVL